MKESFWVLLLGFLAYCHTVFLYAETFNCTLEVHSYNMNDDDDDDDLQMEPSYVIYNQPACKLVLFTHCLFKCCCMKMKTCNLLTYYGGIIYPQLTKRTSLRITVD